MVTAEPLPVTLLSGFLGSGKTTLLQHILTNKKALKCAVIVNDMASVNIDASMVEKGMILHQEEKLVKFQNGCICCTLRGDLLSEISRLCSEHKFDYLVIESSGISEPMQVAETFAMTTEEIAQLGVSEDGTTVPSIADLARLDTCVTVVDATSLMSIFESSESLHQKFEGTEDGDERTVVDLLIDQIEFANVILLNKKQCVSREELVKCTDLLKKLNPDAEVVPTSYSKIKLKNILNTRKFSFDKATLAAGWMQSLKETHTPETIEYGIGTFVYRARRPFHPQRIYDLAQKIFLIMEAPGLKVPDAAKVPEEDDEAMDEDDEINDDDDKDGEEDDDDACDIDGRIMADKEESEKRVANKRASPFKHVFRSKGFMWIATRPKVMGEWSQAGMMLTVSNGGNWFSELPMKIWPEDEEVVASIKKDFDGKHGDKRQEIVFIGQFEAGDQEKITKELDACLVTKKEWKQYRVMKMDGWEDPWEDWEYFAE